jgi:hypothetical protein
MFPMRHCQLGTLHTFDALPTEQYGRGELRREVGGGAVRISCTTVLDFRAVQTDTCPPIRKEVMTHHKH